MTHQHPNVDWSKERDRYRQAALRQLAKIGLGDIEKRIRFERVVTPVEWENKVGIYRGATFNRNFMDESRFPLFFASGVT